MESTTVTSIICCPRLDHDSVVLSLPGCLPSLSPVPPDRLRNNRKPTHAEAHSIAQMLPDARHYLATLEAIARHLNEVRKLVQDNESLVSPVRRLPDHILRIIFSLCCEPEGLHGLPSEGQMDEMEPSRPLLAPISLAAIRISLVCCHWRRVALSTPGLWTDITVWLKDEVEYSKEEFDDCEKIVRLYLERSKEHPLSIRLRFPLETELFEDTVALSEEEIERFAWHRDMIQTLGKTSFRWRQLHLVMPPSNFIYLREESVLGCEFPKLEVAAIEGLPGYSYESREDRRNPHYHPINFPVIIAPNLHALYLNDIVPESEQSPDLDFSLCPSFPLLSTLEIQGRDHTAHNPLIALTWVQRQTCDVVIRGLPCLRRFRKHYRLGDADRIECVARSVTVEALSDSALPKFVEDLFSVVHFSKADTLRFAVRNEPKDSNTPASTLSMLQAPQRFQHWFSASTIERLEFWRLSIPKKELIAVLEALPNVRTLLVCNKDVCTPKTRERDLVINTIRVLDALRLPKALLPHLEKLTLMFNKRSVFKEDELFNLIQSRLSPKHTNLIVSSLRSLVLHLPKEMQLSEHFRKRVRSFERSEVSFSVVFN